MRKVFFVFCVLICVVAGSWFGFLWTKKPLKAMNQDISKTSTAQRVKEELDTVGIPKRLIIESLNVDVPIEEVGLDAEGRMDTPKNVYHTGWYKLGVKPGEAGGALIDGHFDDPQGNPSVFYGLESVEKGDEITIYDEFGKPIEFTIQEVNTYDYDKVPMGELIAPTSQKWVHLITCGGEWDKESKNYTERTVVSAVMN